MAERARLLGVARACKAAAAIETDDGALVYLLDRPAWPDDLVDRRVVVEGVVERTDELTAEVDADGAISQGTGGGDLVIRTSTVRRAP